MENLEKIKCPLCGAEKEKFLFERDGFRVVKCLDCDLVYLNPRLTLEALTKLYNEGEISPEKYYEMNIPQDTSNFKKRLQLIMKHHPTPGKMLDIGCNIGTLMHVAQEKGWETTGVEFNTKAAAFGREKFGLEIIDKDFMETKLPEDHFDVVSMNDVIEHVIDPIMTLEEVNRIMKRGGLLFMTTPNIGALMAKISGKKWLHIKPNEHLTYFTPQTIKKLVEKTGFEMKGWQTIGRIRNLETIMQKTQTYSKIPYAVSKIIPMKLKESINIPINPMDEMAVFAVKK